MQSQIVQPGTPIPFKVSPQKLGEAHGSFTNAHEYASRNLATEANNDLSTQVRNLSFAVNQLGMGLSQMTDMRTEVVAPTILGKFKEGYDRTRKMDIQA